MSGCADWSSPRTTRNTRKKPIFRLSIYLATHAVASTAPVNSHTRALCLATIVMGAENLSKLHALQNLVNPFLGQRPDVCPKP